MKRRLNASSKHTTYIQSKTSMATIYISNLNISGSELLMDTETYLHDLTEAELDTTKGGYLYITSPVVSPTIFTVPMLPTPIMTRTIQF